MINAFKRRIHRSRRWLTPLGVSLGVALMAVAGPLGLVAGSNGWLWG